MGLRGTHKKQPEQWHMQQMECCRHGAVFLLYFLAQLILEMMLAEALCTCLEVIALHAGVSMIAQLCSLSQLHAPSHFP